MKLTVKQLKSLVKETVEQQDPTGDDWVNAFKDAMIGWSGTKVNTQLALDVLHALLHSQELKTILEKERRKLNFDMEYR